MVFAVLAYAALVLLSGTGVLWGIGSLLVGFDRYEEAHAIRTTPVSSLDSVAVGPTAVRGRIEPVDRTITSLYPCDECVAYELEVADTGSDASETHVDRSVAVPFEIVTDDGAIRVETAAFDFHVSPDREWEAERGSYETPDPSLRRFERNFEIPELRTGDDRSYEAAYLCPGDEVYAYGTAEIDESLREGYDKPLVLTDRDGQFFLSDRRPEALVRERRLAVAKHGGVGVVVAVVSLAAFLWLTGIAQVFLGA